MDFYGKPFYITEPVSNNAFSFSKPGARLHKRLYVPALKEGKVEDVQIGSKIVFEDLDEDGCPRPCLGLNHFVKTQLASAPTYIFDNHNHAFAFWHNENIKGNLRQRALLVHIDQHKDTRKPPSFLSKEKAQDPTHVVTYTNNTLNVGNFIPAAQHTGLVKDLVIIDSQYSMDEYQLALQPNQDLILDIDLDFFSPDMKYIPGDEKCDFIRSLIPRAKLITFATSPFFIEQKEALHWLKEITDGFEK